MKQKEKRVLSIMLAAVMIYSMFTAMPVSAYAAETADNADLVISTLEELQAFAAEVDNGKNFDGMTVVLSNDIDAGTVDWDPIGTYASSTDIKAFAGTFDGQGHSVAIKINTENSYQGFFAYNSGTVKNLSIKGSIVGKGYLGGIAGYNAGKITDCKNYANVSGLHKGSSNVAGITGFCKASASVENCGNYGDITIKQPEGNSSGSADYVAGIAGNCAANSVVSGCYNMGKITGHIGYVGGIVGYALGKVENCYNKGEVFYINEKSSKTIGGVVGVLYGSGTISNCYNIGQTTASNGGCGAIAGTATKGRLSNCYFLEDTAACGVFSLPDELKANKADDMKTAAFLGKLGSAFKADFDGNDSTNEGYPILSWQKAGDEPAVSPTVKHTITFVVDDKPYKTTTVIEGTCAGPSSAPAKEGYVFSFWSESKEGTAFDFTAPITKDITLYAVYTSPSAEMIKVTFMNGDVEYKTVDAEKGKTLSQPETPKLDGYNFMYWAVSKNGDKFDFETVITENLTLYAVWEKVPDINEEFEYETIDNGKAIKITKYKGKNAFSSVPEKINDLPVTVIGNEAFMNTSVYQVKLPKTITAIEDGVLGTSTGIKGAFAYCTQLEVVYMPDSKVTKIGDAAFYGSGSNRELRISYPSTLKEIGDYAFACCNSIVTLSLPKSVTKIGNSAFYQARRLANLDIPGVSEIQADAFTETIFEENYEKLWETGEFTGVVYAGKVAYLYMGSMTPDTKLVLEDGTLGISEFLFDNHFTDKPSSKSNLKSIAVPETIKFIPKDVFRGFSAVTDGSFCGLDMYGFKGSYAETYAGNYDNIRFNPIGQTGGSPKCDYDWYDDNKKGDTFIIKTAADLWGFADLIEIKEADFSGATVYIDNDIDIGGISSIGYGIDAYKWFAVNNFKGTLDGRGHTISGVYVNNPTQDNQGFFGELTTAVKIKNLNINGKVSGSDYVGGIVGKLSAAESVVENCSFNGSVIGNGPSGYVGGLVGHAKQSAISNCTSSGTVSCTSSSTAQETQLGATGGIIGYNWGGTVKNCINNSSVTGNAYSIGGITGQNMMAVMSGNKNNGTVSGSIHVGGVAGRSMASAIEDCENHGAVSGHTYAGGIAGTSIGVTSDSKTAVFGCTNTGSIKAAQYAGGIMGYSEGSIVEKAYNEGEVAANYFAGGIMAYNKGFGVRNAYNLGKVSCNSKYAGGIIGFSLNESEKSKVDNCYNMGEIKAAELIDPIANVDQNGKIYSNCYYLANKEDSGDAGKAAKTAAAFTNGEVAYLLGNDYGQQIGTDLHPVFKSGSNSVKRIVGRFMCNGELLFESKEYFNGSLTITMPKAGGKNGQILNGWEIGGKIHNIGDKITINDDFTAIARFGSNIGYGDTSPSNGSSTSTSTSTSSGKTTTTLTAAASVTADGKATLSVTADEMKAAAANAAKDAAAHGTKAAVELKVSGISSAASISATIPQSSFGALAESKIESLSLSMPLATISFDKAAISKISTSAAGDVNISAKAADTNKLSETERSKIGSRPVYDFTITSGSAVLSSFGGGTATVSVPYALAKGENPNNVVIYYVSDDGRLETVKNCIYNEETASVTFCTSHFSAYAVGYNAVSFTDISGWYTNYVSYLSARGIINGTGSGKFSPDSSITRAQFVTILANMSGDDLGGYTASSFTDVAEKDWYFPAVQWAYSNGIVSGFGGKFEPNSSITREQMAAMLYNYAKYAGIDVSNTGGEAISEFSDYKCISEWASEPVIWAKNANIINGVGDGSFAPQASATRAQAAKMSAVLMQLMLRK